MTGGDVTGRANAVLRQRWGATYSLRPFQARVIKALLAGQDAIVVSGTGSGKSLCFQLPPLLEDYGVAVVVSPLISLMRDQCAALEQMGVRATLLGSAQTDPQAERRALAGEASLIFVCPESLPRLLAAGLAGLREGGDRPMWVAVDECHCVSRWGHVKKTHDSLCLIRFCPAVSMAVSISADS